MSKKKLITFSNQLVEKIQKDADEKGVSFNEMTRRLLDQLYDEKETREKSNAQS